LNNGDFLKKLKEVDWTRNITLMFIYFLMIFLLFVFFLYPELQDTKAKNIEYRKAKLSYDATISDYSAKKSAIEQFEKENEKILQAFKTKATVQNITDLATLYIQNLSVAPSSPRETKYDSNIFFVEGFINTPKDFYNFINSLKGSGYILNISFPIAFEKKEEKIKVGFEVVGFYRP